MKILILAGLLTVTLSCSKNIKQTDKMTKEEMEEMERQESEGFKQMAEANSNNFNKMPYFPAEASSNGQYYSVQITAISGMFFTDEFEQHDLYGNGYCWEGVIEQVLEQKNPGLLKRIKFDPEADTCFISCPDEGTMNELAKTIHEFCSTKEKMLKVLESIDKSRLDC